MARCNGGSVACGREYHLWCRAEGISGGAAYGARQRYVMRWGGATEGAATNPNMDVGWVPWQQCSMWWCTERYRLRCRREWYLLPVLTAMAAGARGRRVVEAPGGAQFEVGVGLRCTEWVAQIKAQAKGSPYGDAAHLPHGKLDHRPGCLVNVGGVFRLRSNGAQFDR